MMMLYYKIKNYFRKRKNISSQFISNNKIWTLYIKRNDEKNTFYISHGLKKYKISFTNEASWDKIKKNDILSNDLGVHFETEKYGINNWELLIQDYYGTGHLNEDFIWFKKPKL